MSRILIDDCFYVEETPWKTWKSYDKENCINATRFYLKGLQDGWPESEKTYESQVGGKL